LQLERVIRARAGYRMVHCHTTALCLAPMHTTGLFARLDPLCPIRLLPLPYCGVDCLWFNLPSGAGRFRCER